MYIAYTDNKTGFNAIKNIVKEDYKKEKSILESLYTRLHKDKNRFYFYFSYSFFEPYYTVSHRNFRSCIRGL